MAGAQRVDVVLLHQPNVRFVQFGADRVAAAGVKFVPVHPAQLDGPPVEQQQFAVNAHLAKAHGKAACVQQGVAVFQRQRKAVQRGVFIAPQRGGLYRKAERLPGIARQRFSGRKHARVVRPGQH
ncbi:hypothetical protein SDC9_122262 [bioreactor metagenome]|uniref:Uncharacterized protein n=1 Tax=bioreactor metagenome TaxID=1076179 RepID=A0A645CEE3_9ZZZZ